MQMSTQLVKCDGGRSLSSVYPTLKSRWVRRGGMRFKLVQDCVIRAVSTACEIDYDQAYEILEAEEDGSVFDYGEKMERKTINGWNIEPVDSWPPNLTRTEFPKLFPVGRFICAEHGGKHLVTYIDGTRYDEGLPRDVWNMVDIWTVKAVAA